MYASQQQIESFIVQSMKRLIYGEYDIYNRKDGELDICASCQDRNSNFMFNACEDHILLAIIEENRPADCYPATAHAAIQKDRKGEILLTKGDTNLIQKESDKLFMLWLLNLMPVKRP